MTEESVPEKEERRRKRRRRRPGGIPHTPQPSEGSEAVAAPEKKRRPRPRRSPGASAERTERPPRSSASTSVDVSGLLDLREDGTGFLRQLDEDLKAQKTDPMIPAPLTRKFGLKNGSIIAGKGTQSRGHDSPRVNLIETVDGEKPTQRKRSGGFQKFTVIDPDFQYELGGCEQEGQLSMRILDLLCPLGRGQRGLLVAPPRTGKTTLMQQIATSIQGLYPDVHLMILLVDERPEEATYWRRAVKNGEVYVSTMDESPKNHVRLAELVQFRAERLVEAGKEVVILLDSITRLTRAYNNLLGGKDSKTMSGGLSTNVFTKPKRFFGAARNTEDAGSLTILATALIRTGSRMDDIIFEEFKGTGNMELTLDRMLADRRIFPAMSITSTGTRKEERLFTRTTMKKINILRRVLSRMRPREAMEMMIDRLAQYPSNEDFLAAFSLDDVS
ncbi:MAG: transcription termination factor Rho [Planctomycetota bacterium]|nr:transcription termination factor Rho [Planctomycetota bacterium]